jgi:hypothetical protein
MTPGAEARVLQGHVVPWAKALSEELRFPLRLDGKRSLIQGRLVELRALRNRIAHHERITCGKRNIQKDYAELLETIGWISKPMKNSVEQTNCFEERFAKKLPKKASSEAVPIQHATPDIPKVMAAAEETAAPTAAAIPEIVKPTD